MLRWLAIRDRDEELPPVPLWDSVAELCLTLHKLPSEILNEDLEWINRLAEKLYWKNKR